MSLLIPAVEEAERVLLSMAGVRCTPAVFSSAVPDAESIIREVVGVDIPPALRQIYSEEAGAMEFSWVAEEDVFGGDFMRGNLSLLAPERAAQLLAEQRRQVLDIRAKGVNGIPEGYAAMVADWPHWLPIFRFPSGDCLCLELRDRDAEPSVVFLEHDVMDAGPNLHGLRIGRGLKELVARWGRVCFVEPFDWSQVVNEEGIDLNNASLTRIACCMDSWKQPDCEGDRRP